MVEGSRPVTLAAFAVVSFARAVRCTVSSQSLQVYEKQEYFGPSEYARSYHPPQVAWSNVTYPPASPDGLTNFDGSVIGDRIYVVGGRCGTTDAGCVNGVLGRTIAFDTSTKAWLESSSFPMLNTPRSNHRVSTVGKTLYVAGGALQTSPATLLDTLEWFDTSEPNGVWKIGQCCIPGCPSSTKTDASTPCTPTARYDFNMETVGTIVYVLNGQVTALDSPELPTNTRAVEAFDTITRKWNTDLPAIPGPARRGASSTTSGTTIYVFGGAFSNSTDPTGLSNLRTLQAFDTITSTWKSLPDVGCDYSCGCSCPIAIFQHSIYIIFGEGESGPALMYSFDLDASNWIAASQPPSMPSGSNPINAGDMYTWAMAGAVGNTMYVVNGKYVYSNNTEPPLGTIAFTCAEEWYGPNCNECAPDRYGPKCVPCQCNRGSCGPSGFNYSGTCTSCYPHWSGANCTNCDPAYFGVECKQPCVCGPHGASNSSGVDGTGKCATCKGNWDISSNCVDCVGSYFGDTCEKRCTCNEDGASNGCNSGMRGNGHCIACESTWAGADCTDCTVDYFGSSCQTPCTCSIHGKENISGIIGTGHCNGCQKHYSGLDCTICNGKPDPDDCATDYALKCDDPVIGQKVSLNCPFMCNTCTGGPENEIIIIAASSGSAVTVLLAVIVYLLFCTRRGRGALSQESTYTPLANNVGDVNRDTINDAGNNADSIYE